MNITDFAVIAKLNSAETAALQDILSDKTIMAMAEVIAAERFRNYPAEGSEDFPENDMLAQAWFAAAYLSIGHSKEKFRQLGYPESVWRDTMSDMVLWLRNEHRNSGVIGLGPVAREWTAVLYNGDVLRFGRLECNAKYCFKGDDIFDAGNNLLLAQGSEVINLHIPEDGAMSMDLCSVSLKKMAGFFAEYRPEYHWQGFICQSWLLDSQLQTMLPENSNILAFARDYTVLATRIDPGSSAVSFIFHVPGVPADLESLPEDTSLQKALKLHLKAGKTINTAFGIMEYKAMKQ